MIIQKAKGNGQCQCTGCRKKGNWNVHWTEFMYKIEGYEGVYCRDCKNEIEAVETYENRKRQYRDFLESRCTNPND